MKLREGRRPSHRQNRHLSRYQRVLFALSMALLALVGAAFMQTPRAHAAGTGPIIHWDQTMIYPGQNNGNPEGPVGEPVLVHGEGFTANQVLKLMLVPGDSLKDATVCKVGTNYTVVGPQVTADASGTFSANFAWPSMIDANKIYSICGISPADNSVVSTRDDGPFTVLAPISPSFTLSTTSVAAGGTLTISGKNWVPPQPLNIDIAGCADCDPGNSTVATATTSSAGLNTGTFSVTVPIPDTAKAGNYVVNVLSQNGPLDAYHLPVGIQHLTVTAPVATPTPAVTPSPVASSTAGSTPTTINTNTDNTSNTTSSGGNSGLLIVVVVIIVILLLAIGGIIFYMVAQRKKLESSPTPPSGSPSTPTPGAGPFNQYGAQGGPITPFPSAPNQQGQFGSSPSGGYAGYNNQQPWQGNPNNYQQGQAFQQQPFAPTNRTCVRCGSPLQSPICGRCGTNNSAMSDPNGPTIAY